MSTSSSIEWTDATWNPLAGCTKPSTGCAHCYAAVMSKRLGAMAKKDIEEGRDPGEKRKYLDVVDDRGHWTGKINLSEEALTEPLKWKKPRRVFVNSMSDLFWGTPADLAAARKAGQIDPQPVPFEFIDKVFAVMALTPQHTYQILTKRPERMAEYLDDFPGAMHPRTTEEWEMRDAHSARHRIAAITYKTNPELAKQMLPGEKCCWPLPNVILMTSVENQEQADKRIPWLLKCPAALRGLSVEPLLGAIDLTSIADDGHNSINALTGNQLVDDQVREGHVVDWVIVGGESGAGARPMHPDWARSIRDQCQAAGLAFFFKQWGEWSPFATEARYAAGSLMPGNDEIVGGECGGPSAYGDHRTDKNGRSTVLATWWSGDGGRRDKRVEIQNRGDHRWGKENLQAMTYLRLGKKSAGRLLDGRTWDEMPQREAQ